MAGAAFLCMIALSCNVARAQIYNWTTIAGVANTIGSADGTNSGALFNAPYGVALDGSGNVYVADYAASTIRKMTHVGTNWVVTTIAGSAANSGSADGINTAALFNGPRGLVVGNNGNIFISDEGNHCIRMLTAIGTNWVSSTIAESVTNPGSADGTNSAAQFEGVEGNYSGQRRKFICFLLQRRYNPKSDPIRNKLDSHHHCRPRPKCRVKRRNWDGCAF